MLGSGSIGADWGRSGSIILTYQWFYQTMLLRSSLYGSYIFGAEPPHVGATSPLFHLT